MSRASLPELQAGWLNDWLLPALLYAIFGVLLWLFPRDVVSRLYDRSGWTRRDYLMRLLSAPVALTYFVLLIFLPLRLGERPFYIGMLIYAVGLVALIVALLQYRAAPPDKPATHGIYRFSRNPQAVGLLLSFIGAAVAVGSWLLVGVVLLMGVLMHTRILAEERACLAQYPDAYPAYRQQAPRYFWRV